MVSKLAVSLFLTALFVGCSFALENFDIGQWRHLGRAHRDELVNTTVSLSLRNVADLQKTFEEVSNPRHPNWRKYLTREEVFERYYPSKEALSFVSAYLLENGALAVDESMGQSITATFTVGTIERLLQVEMRRYKSIDGKQTIIRSPTLYRLPSQLAGIVDLFSLVSEFPPLHLSAHTKFDRKQQIAMEKRGKEEVKASDGSCNVAVPSFGYPQSSDSDLYSQVQIVCCGGNHTKDAANPCSDFLPALTGFMVEVKNNFTGLSLFNDFIDISAVECYNDGVGVTCNLPWTLLHIVDSYQQYNLFVTEVFGKNNSATAMFPTALVTSAFVTPQLFAQYYDIPLNYRAVAPNNIQSVVEFGGQYYSPTDLSNFFGNMSIVGAPVTVVGPNDPTRPGDEATLDIEWMMGVSVGVPTTFWSIGHGYLIEWTNALLNSPSPPLVNSASYSGNEATSPLVYRSRVDQNFQLLGTRGVSIVFASGDAGASDVGHGFDACSPLQPQYPSTSPFVTSVSATYFTPSAEGICNINYFGKRVHCSQLHMGEVAVGANNGMDWTTGGGFSNSSPRPSYQNAAVSSYLQNNAGLLPPSNMFNSSNRAYPDVSSTGHNLVLILKGEMDIGDGTSAATPIFAGILAMLNDWLLSINEPPIGFANPLLYDIAASYPQAFYDVTYGDNKCGDVLHPPYIACCPYGYTTSTGWDPVTGLGTPRYEALLAALQNYISK